MLELLRAGDAQVEVTVLELALRAPFGTSHSSTTARRNVLFTVRAASTDGRGESGLPPRKPGVYEGTVAACFAFARAVCGRCGAMQPPARSAIEEGPAALRILLGALDAELASAEQGGRGAAARAAASGLEAAVLDCAARVAGVPMHALLGLARPEPPTVGFFTAALAEPVAAMMQAAEHGARCTPHLKVKLNADVGTTATVLAALAGAADGGGRSAGVWALDANAAWTPEGALRQLDAIRCGLCRRSPPVPPWVTARPAGRTPIACTWSSNRFRCACPGLTRSARRGSMCAGHTTMLASSSLPTSHAAPSATFPPSRVRPDEPTGVGMRG